MLPGADFFDFLADEFAGLCGGGFPFALIAARTFDGLFLWHDGLREFAAQVATGCKEVIGASASVSAYRFFLITALSNGQQPCGRMPKGARHPRKRGED